jgi:hypothetical protein
MEEKNDYFTRKKNAVKEIRKLSKELMKNDLKGWDPVKELRKARDGRAHELLKR